MPGHYLATQPQPEEIGSQAQLCSERLWPHGRAFQGPGPLEARREEGSPGPATPWKPAGCRGGSERSLWSCSESNPPWADPPGGSLPGCPSKELALECNSSPAQVLLSHPGGPCWSLGPRGTPCWGTARKEVAKGAGSPRGQAYDHRHQTPDKGQSSFLRSSSPVWSEWQHQDLWSPQRKAKAPMSPAPPPNIHTAIFLEGNSPHGRRASASADGPALCPRGAASPLMPLGSSYPIGQWCRSMSTQKSVHDLMENRIIKVAWYCGLSCYKAPVRDTS